MKIRRKLIEVALPLDNINKEASREKSLRHGHPSTLHLWWARRPLAAARAVLFAQLVNAPETGTEREQLFDIIRELIKWENIDNHALLARARQAIMASWRQTCEDNSHHPEAKTLFNPQQLPAVHDPFAGGGAIPLEAKRLGLHAYASDLNPIAVLINKAMLEIPAQCKDTQKLAQDIKKYGELLRQRAFKKIGKLYPQMTITEVMARQRPELKQYRGQQLTVVAYLWARTVKSTDPAYSDIDVPLISSYVLSAKQGKEAYLKPIVKGKKYHFAVVQGTPPEEAKQGTKTGRGNFQCLISRAAIDAKEIRQQGKDGKMGAVLTAIVLEGKGEKIYLAADDNYLPQNLQMYDKLIDKWQPQQQLADSKRYMTTIPYGLTRYGDLFTTRQLIALATFCEALQALPVELEKQQGKAYADTICTYLALVISKCVGFMSSICSWDSSKQKIRHTFARQAIPMTWDYAEANPFSASSGNWSAMLAWLVKAIKKLPTGQGTALQLDAVQQNISKHKIVSTDPPYYDNIGYADLSDFFYVWLRPLLKDTYPQLFRTVSTPKDDELISAPHRHGNDKQQANCFFQDGISAVIKNFRDQAHPAFPVTIYYAFKQTEGNGWQTFLQAVIDAGFVISGTWPMRTEMKARMRNQGSNALASSIVLVCKPRTDKTTIDKREWKRKLHRQLWHVVSKITAGDNPIAAVDLAQAVIGPGMEIFSQYEAVLSADGNKMDVTEALQLINRELSNEENFDRDTSFCIKWFKEHGWQAGAFGDAETLAKAKGVAVESVREAGVLAAKAGKVNLKHWQDYPEKWHPADDKRLPAWEATHHLIKTIDNKGEREASRMLQQLRSKEEEIKQLSYHLYQLCEQQKRTEDAGSYNMLIQSWPALKKAA